MRTFVDEQGTEWEVRQIHVPSLSVVPRHMLPHPEYADGWLLFSCASERRRIAPFPLDWHAIPVAELLRCCQDAKPVRDRPAGQPSRFQSPEVADRRRD